MPAWWQVAGTAWWQEEQPASGLSSTEEASGMTEPSTTADSESFSVSVITLSGESRMVDGLTPGTSLQELLGRAASALGLPASDVELCLDTRRFGFSDRTTTLAAAGVTEGAALTCICQRKEAWFLDPDMLRMVASERNDELAAAAVSCALKCRPEVRSMALAKEAAEAREASRAAAEARASLAKAHGYHDEGRHSLEIYESRRRTVEFAQAAAEAREDARRARAAARAAADVALGDGLEDYDSRRRTVEFAVQAAAEREARLEALCMAKAG